MQLHSDIRRARQEEDKPLLPHSETGGDKGTEGPEERWTDRQSERMCVVSFIIASFLLVCLPPQ